jgi:hypothetical protein
MISSLDGSPIRTYRLAAEAAPNGGLIAMAGANPVATAVREGDVWVIRSDGKEITRIAGNASNAACFLHGLFTGMATALALAREEN